MTHPNTYPAKPHLTDEQLLQWLDGSASPPSQAHLESCARCRAEAFAIQDGISRYVISLRRQAAQAQSTHLTGDFAPAGILAQHRLRWAGALVLALLLAAQTAWMMKPRPAQSASHPAAAAHPHPAAASDDPLSDDELLQAVNNDLSREVPQALAPVGAITVARNRIAASAAPAIAGHAKQNVE
jgi:hypothetical protein